MVAVRCRNPATALLIRKKKFLAPEKGHHFFLLLAVLGGVYCRFHKNFSEKGNQEHPAAKKIKKRK
jgi:hypothetical protein